jgi:AbiV family abortive infection protein
MASKRGLSDESRRALLREFRRGADLIFSNAEQLFYEAEALRKNGSLARALFLHQISMEECAKIEMIGAWATTLLMGENVDLKVVGHGFRSHKAKNHTNAYMASVIGEELEARKRGDWEGAMKAFNEFKTRFHNELNTAKNAALYVDFEGGVFTAPKDVVNEETAVGIWALNQHFLHVTFPHLRLLRRIEEDDGSWERAVKTFTARAEELRATIKDEPEAAMQMLMDEMLKAYRDDKTESPTEDCPSRQEES